MASQPQFLTQRVAGMLNVKELSDTTFLVEGEEFYASKFLLAAANDYFKTMLFGDTFKEAGVGPAEPIEIHGVDKATFLLCLQFLYCGTPELTHENVEAALRAADMFRIDALCTACCQAIAKVLGATNCFRFLALADSLPHATAKARQACYQYLEEHAGDVLESKPAPEDVCSLSFGTMLEVCRRVGLGWRSLETPEESLSQLMGILTSWGEVHLGPGEAKSPAELCRTVCQLRADQLLAEAQSVEEQVLAFDVTVGDLARSDTEKRSEAFVTGGFSFHVDLMVNDRGTSDFGLYLCPNCRERFPSWWQCHVAHEFRRPGDGMKVSVGDVLTSCDFFDFDELLAPTETGYPHFLPYTALPEVSDSFGALSENDIRCTLEIKARIVLNSLASACMAYAFFHPEVWAAIDDAYLMSMLRSDALPVASEDEVLRQLLLLGRECWDLEKLAQHLRWQYLSPAVLLEACRQDRAGSFRSCSITKEGLHWLLGGEKPESACERRRNCYLMSVRDCRPVKHAAIVDWLLGDVPAGASCL